MKIIVLASSTIASPCIGYLQHQKLLSAVVCPTRNDQGTLEFLNWANAVGLTVNNFSQEELQSGLIALIDKCSATAVIAISFPYKIPELLLGIPKYGFLNIHFSRLPAYRGPCPVFWQIKNGEQQTGITLQRMSKKWDDGELINCLTLPIHPEETTGLLTAKLSQLSVEVLAKAIATHFEVQQQTEIPLSSYQSRPAIEDMCIDWVNDDAIKIMNLVNACNPSGGGALCLYHGMPIQILEVSLFNGLGAQGVKGGTIVRSDLNGLFVQCADGKILNIIILKINEGTYSGSKFANMGIKAGEILNNYYSLSKSKSA